ncbi:sulfatase-like hydrolase/transferase [uncultured Lutibacter sp.]|uniref:sulfatase-like hydrolase/transferase n=1 Tax=uncultured Lutibacter sp. TaxID=437739 RepID=UPI002610186C|nr:sulfatase-like hydrolase/transferase [uncultured Lutibacter sp.]
MFDSNRNETLDFLLMYLDGNLIFMIVLMLITVFASILLLIPTKKIKEEKYYFANNKFKIKYKILMLICAIGFLSIYKVRSAIIPHVLIKAIIDYKESNLKYKILTKDRLGGEFSNVIHNESSENEVYVLIIGESTNRNHMQLYGYERNTNPNLNKIRNELLIYNDVISPHAHTIEALEKCLTLSSFEYPEKKFDGTIVQLFNKANFSTYWVSNQIPFGVFETGTTLISNNCNEQIFTNIQSGSKSNSLDEKIFHPLNKILKNKKQKKFIIIHLMGTHSRYSRRYSQQYDVFKGKTQSSIDFKGVNFDIINEYDNAIMYNDYIVNNIIDLVRGLNCKSFVLYLSDHGEDVYDTGNFVGHSDSKSTKPMYDIPFILWKSTIFNEEEKGRFTFNINRKFTTEDLMYSLSDLSNINFKEFDSTKSIFNKKFKEKERLISNKKKYESFYDFQKK